MNLIARDCLVGVTSPLEDLAGKVPCVPGVSPVRVGCVLTDRGALARVTSAIRQEHGRIVALTRREVLDATPGGRIAGLIYDMEPGDTTAVDLVRRVHAARPDWPMWLYHAPRAAVIEGVGHVASLRGVWATSQGTGPLHEKELRMHARRLVTSVPRVRLLYLLDKILRPLPAEVREFLGVVLQRLDGGEAKRFRIRNGTAGNRGNLRHLERLCVTATGLGPKRLFDHLLLVLLTFKALAFDVPLEHPAEQARLSRKDLDRLRHRILGTDAESAALEPRAQFEYALMALTKVCKAPPGAAGEIVQQVVRERLA